MIAGDDIIGDARASYPPFVHLARGCRWEKSALTAMISGVYESASYPRRRRLRELQQVVKMKASANVGSPAVRNHLPCDQ